MDNKAARAILETNAWYAGLKSALADEILRLGHFRRVKNERLFGVGDGPDGLFAVLEGEAHISQTSADGRNGLLLVSSAGSWFGKTSTLDGEPRISEAFAVGRCELLHLSMSGFRMLTHDSVSNLYAFVRIQCDHYRLAIAHIASLSVLPARVRVAQRLIFYAGKQRVGEKSANIVRLSQEDLASAVGISRQALNVHLKRFEREGVRSVNYAAVEVREIAKLERVIKQGGGALNLLRHGVSHRSAKM